MNKNKATETITFESYAIYNSKKTSFMDDFLTDLKLNISLIFLNTVTMTLLQEEYSARLHCARSFDIAIARIARSKIFAVKKSFAITITES